MGGADKYEGNVDNETTAFSDEFDKLDAAIKRREKLREEEEFLKHRTWSGYERKVKQVGKKDLIDKEWDKKLYDHRDEIRQFYLEHPELGRPKND